MREIQILFVVATFTIAGCAAKRIGDGAPTYEGTTLTHVGEIAPTVSVQTLDGKTLDTASFRGRPVMLVFFATWCTPCVAEAKELQTRVWEKFPKRGLEVLAISEKEGPWRVKGFAEQRGLTYDFAVDPHGAAYAHFATGYIPRLYVIDADGKIRYQAVGYLYESDWSKMVSVIESTLK